jgi:hypothetical protein
MTPPLVATARIQIPYIVSGFTHIHHAYVRNAQLVGGNWLINSRALDENDTNWHDAVDSILGSISFWAPNGTTVGAALLQKRSGGIWNNVDLYSPAFNPTGGGGPVAAGQATLTLKDKLLYNFKVQFMELQESYPQLIKNPTAGDADMDDFIGRYTQSGGASLYPYDFIVSRLDQFVASSPFVSLSVFLNRKVARARGV